MFPSLPSVKDNKCRISSSDRRKQKKVRIHVAKEDVEERELNALIRESDAMAGYERYYGIKIGSDVDRMKTMTSSSAGVSGWARYERKARQNL